jgi:DNA modification methylase
MGIANIAESLKPLATPIGDLSPLPGNPRKGDVEAVKRSYERFGQRKPIVANRDGTVIAGNHQLKAAQALGWEEIAVVFVDDDDQTAKAFALADNRTADLGTYDTDNLEQMLADLALDPILLEATGYSVSLSSFSDAPNLPQDTSGLPESSEPSPASTPTLVERFVISPFTVLDARSGVWQERKRRWLSLGIRSEIGRGESQGEGSFTFAKGRSSEDPNLDPVSAKIPRSGPKALLFPSLSGRIPDYYVQKNVAEAKLGHALTNKEFESNHLEMPDYGGLSNSGTSVFDPVLCELAYRWFSPTGGLVLDPFAGGSVRGIMAALLGRRYIGIDLRQEQIEANDQQKQQIVPSSDLRWICGDSRQVLPTLTDVEADLLFSCPPYADLEVYSDDPNDISNMGFPGFLDAYRDIIDQSCQRLKKDRYAVIVIGDARDSKGNYYNLIGETVQAFKNAGLTFYNEAILVTSVGSLPVRVGRQFSVGRKLGKTHQNVLVFLKGDGKRAAQACGDVEVTMPDWWEDTETEEIADE